MRRFSPPRSTLHVILITALLTFSATALLFHSLHRRNTISPLETPRVDETTSNDNDDSPHGIASPITLDMVGPVVNDKSRKPVIFSPKPKKKDHTATQTNSNNNYLRLPSRIKGVIINIGCHMDPIISDDEEVAVIAFEPSIDVVKRIPPRPNLFVIPAAVSSRGGLFTMFRYWHQGVASSLGEAVPDEMVLKLKGAGEPFFVPVITLHDILAAIPPWIDVLHLKTDAQGFDLEVIKSAGPLLSRVYRMCNEVDKYGFQHYKDTRNDLLLDWMPYWKANEDTLKFKPDLRVPGFLQRFPKGDYGDRSGFKKEISNNADWYNEAWESSWDWGHLGTLRSRLLKCENCYCG